MLLIDEPAPSEKSKESKKDDQDNAAPIIQPHFSPSDPAAHLTMKPGKPMNLYYKAQMSGDTESHFITHIQAFAGNVADNVSLPEILNHLVENMNENDIGLKKS